jgi:hypothetical protein
MLRLKYLAPRMSVHQSPVTEVVVERSMEPCQQELWSYPLVTPDSEEARAIAWRAHR